MQNEKFLADIRSDDKDVRFAAWRAAGDADPSVIASLAGLVDSKDNPGVAKASREAMITMVHSVGKDVNHPKRAAVVQELIQVSGSEQASLAARVHAYRLLSNIAPEGSAADVAKGLTNADLREEAIYCLERLPGTTSNKLLVAAYRTSKDDFKPRILAALGHRKAEEGVALSLEAMRSSNADLANAGARAFARIGKKALVTWPKAAETDTVVRYANALRDSGNSADAMRLYKMLLARPEPHLQCAAITGLSKMGSADAASAIFPQLKSANSRVRITASNAWKGMAKA